MTHSTEQTCSCLLLLWIFCLFLHLAHLPLIMFDTFETESLGFSFWRHQLTLLYYYLFLSVSPIFPINLILALALKSLWLQLIYFCRNTLAGLHWIDIITLYCWVRYLIPNETSRIWNNSNTGLWDSFLVGIILSMSALVNSIYYLCSIVEKLMI